MRRLNTMIKNTIKIIIIFIAVVVHAQEIDILIKNGHVFDPKNNIDTILDVAITEGKILQVAPNITPDSATKVIDATGLYVCPGLIDIHTHVFVGSTLRKFANGTYSLSPDDFTFKAGITTVVDAGCSGWRNFPLFKKQIVEKYLCQKNLGLHKEEFSDITIHRKMAKRFLEF